MRDNNSDRTIECKYLQKWCFLIPGYEPVRERFAIGDERHNRKRHATYPSLAVQSQTLMVDH